MSLHVSYYANESLQIGSLTFIVLNGTSYSSIMLKKVLNYRI